MCLQHLLVIQLSRNIQYNWIGPANTFSVYFCCPETRGKSLEEIDLIFMSSRLRDTEAAKTLEHERMSVSGTSDEASAQEEAIAVKVE